MKKDIESVKIVNSKLPMFWNNQRRFLTKNKAQYKNPFNSTGEIIMLFFRTAITCSEVKTKEGYSIFILDSL